MTRTTVVSLAWLAVIAAPSRGYAQHFDVLVQSVDGRLVTGTTDFDVPAGTPPVTSLGVRTYSRPFNSLFAIDDPGWTSVGTTTGTAPPGSDALPGNSDLFWDFLPMKVGAVASNLLYWTGAGATPAQVSFGPAPGVDYSLSLFGKNDVRVAADGTGQMVPGSVVATTETDGFIHLHRYFFLDNDHDDGNATVAADGVYLIALRLRMDGLDRSDPFYIAWSTPGVSAATLAAAADWVDDRSDQLAPHFAADFDGDLDVDGADLLTWQRYVGTTTGALQIQGDANGDHAIDAADLAAWQAEFGLSVATFPGAASAAPLLAATPEPSGALIVAGISCSLVNLRRRRRPPLANRQPFC